MPDVPPSDPAPGADVRGARARGALSEYCSAIAASARFQKASDQIDAFIADEDARQSYVRWSHLQAGLDERSQRGFELTAGEVHAYETARKTALQNPLVSGYLEATEDLATIRRGTLEWLDKTFELKRAPTDADWKAEAKLREKEARADAGG